MFVPRLALVGTVLLVVILAALGAARPTSGAARGEDARAERYVVEAGDTLWVIAERRYDGDPREGVWLIRERNGIGSGSIQPGQVLVLP
ncbi:MAG: LysM peptidoglycan-binding domain-containing protein [Thermoleophilia bacterium]|nr:LysM peptidoglycan-binding domain-containing protein [Thermoleophilia bacterium]